VTSRQQGRAIVVLWMWSVLGLGACSAKVLSPKEAQLLVENAPDAVKDKRYGGCLSSDYSDFGGGLALVQLRNMCPRSGMGMIGNYFVDLNSGRIWSDVDRTHAVDSPRLRTLRERFFKGKRTGPRK